MKPTPEMIEAARSVLCVNGGARPLIPDSYVEEALTAALALLSGETQPVGIPFVGKDRVQGMVRGIDQYRNGVPEKIVEGSPAQVLYALKDARHDVLVLWDKLVAIAKESNASPAPLPVAVKALEWIAPSKSTNYCWIAKSPFGTYSVVDEDGWYAAREPGDYWEWNGDRIIDTRDSAFRACETDYETKIRSALSSPVGTESHTDDLAVDRFAVAMKAKLAKKRADGRGGWDNPDECSIAFLSNLLREHVGKGDPIDVGNLAMMIHQRGGRIV